MAGGREYTRVFLTVCCVVALVLSAVSLPALSGGPTAPASGPSQSGSGPADGGQQGSDSGGTGERTSTATAQTAGSNGQGGNGTGGGAPGALSTGERTTVGGDRSAFRSSGQEVHFTVRSSAPSYWRTNAYAEYTGSGWEDQGELTAYDGGEIPGDTAAQRRVVQRYRLNRSGNSLPAAWRPVAVDGVDTELRVTEQRALKTSSRFEAGTTYELLSYTPPRDPARLRETGRSYPDSIEDQYTQLPASTEARLAPFTRRLVGDSESPYQTAVLIEEWLETNKEYSLNASHSSGSGVATAFVFSMDRGYCEYFATAMVAMLRSQDVPARYVTGYSTGQPVGDDEYVVRGMNAHAWVEVYFEDVGWVRFDPTPGSERLGAEAQAYAQGSPESSASGSGSGGEAGSTATSEGPETDASDRAEAYRHQEVGSPGETMGRPSEGESNSSGTRTSDADSGAGQSTADGRQGTGEPGDSQSSSEGESSSGEESSTDESSSAEESSTDESSSAEKESDEEPDDDANDSEEPSDEDPEQPYETELNRTELIPGTDVQVTVTRNDDPAAGVTVLFNGERVGDTDQEGTVVGTVPYTAELNVTVASGDDAQSVPRPPPLGSSTYFDVRTPPVSALRSSGSGSTTPDVDTYDIRTNATVETTGPPIPGSTVVVQATINGTPLAGATVAVGEANVTETNQSGRASITLPADARRTQVRVSRKDVSGEREITVVTRLNVSVRGEFHPRGAARVNVTARGHSVENATVAVGDRVLGRTAGGGTVRGQFPQTTGRVAVTATKGVAEGTQSLTLERLTLAVTPRRGVALPWTDVRIRSELGNESVGGVAIRLNGRAVGETGADGTLRATLPPTYGVTVTGVGYGQRVSSTAGNPLLLLVVGGAAGLLTVGVAVRRGRRSERTVRGSFAAFLTLGRGVGQRVFGAIVTLASLADDLVRTALGVIRVVRADLAAVPRLLAGVTRRARQRLTAAVGWMQRTARRVAAWVAGAAQRAHTAIRNPRRSLALLAEWLAQRLGSDESGAVGGTDDGAGSTGATGDSGGEQDPRLTVREAWREFLGYVSVRRWRTKTPGQISRRAIESDGLPPDAVRLLTNAFRDVEYGDRAATDSVTGAREALETLKRATHDEEEDTDE